MRTGDRSGDKGMGLRLVLGLFALLLNVVAAHATCQVDRLSTIALGTADNVLTVPVEVNGKRGTFVLDTGAARTLVTRDAVARLGLARDEWVGTTLKGIGGVERLPNALPSSISLGGIPLVRRTTTRDTSLTVGTMPNAAVAETVLDGLLGRDFLSSFDLEFDQGRVTLHRVAGCSGRFLPWTAAYRAVPTEESVDTAVVLPVSVDGVGLRALLDSGANNSLLAVLGIARMKLTEATLASDPVVGGSGVGRQTVRYRVHTFKSLTVGGATIGAPRVLVAPVAIVPRVDMLLGAEWLLRHHVWVSFATRQLFLEDRIR